MYTEQTPVFCILSGKRGGQWNMDFDAGLLDAFRKKAFQQKFGENAVVWRFYGWDPPAISLGYGQSFDAIDTDACKRYRIEVVKRMTGGRAVFHADDFTYSFLAETAKSNAFIYAGVHEILRLALLQLGVESTFCRSQPDFRKHYERGESISCFTASARNELQADGRKIMGSAQYRSGNVVFQHGSLMLSERYRELCHFLKNNKKGILESIQEKLEKSTVSVSELTGSLPGFSTVADAVMQAISSVWKTEIRLLDIDEVTALF